MCAADVSARDSQVNVFELLRITETLPSVRYIGFAKVVSQHEWCSTAFVAKAVLSHFHALYEVSNESFLMTF